MTNMRPQSLKPVIKVLLLGNGGVGKTCLMNRFCTNKYDETNMHTIGVEFIKKDIVINNETYTLQIWDTAGQERYHALRTPFYRGSDICMLCFSIDDEPSFRALSNWRDQFIKYADVPSIEQFPFLVIGNKNDVPAINRRVLKEDVQAWCQANNIGNWIEASAKNSTNVNEAFVLAVKQWKRFEGQNDREMHERGMTIDYNNRINIPSSNNSCCHGSQDNSRLSNPNSDNL